LPFVAKPPSDERRTTDADVRWVVRTGDGDTVGDIARQAGADEAAIREGRVFVGRVRVRDPDTPVAPGHVVRVSRNREPTPSVRLLADEDGLVAVDKPAGIPTIPDHGGSAHSLLAALATTLGCDAESLHPTSRLDRDVSGVVVFAKTREARERLATARKEGSYSRRYAAIACKAPEPVRGAWDVPIGRAKDPRKRLAFGRDATDARSLYEVVARAGRFALLALEPVTGRTHQLRVHAAHANAALLGDRDYGGENRAVLPSGRVLAVRRIALHAGRVIVPLGSGGALEVRSDAPDELRELWRALGGADEAWSTALYGASMNDRTTSK
jgi:23S rRNA pseudouridine1911/1915/1917 synthase